jgi:acid phosphatase
MNLISTFFKGLPLLAACVMAVNYPTIPADLTTPVQQRIAINGPNGEFKYYYPHLFFLNNQAC